jgi:ATPase subunit of ABC transporter with duplicated ATPase domains
MTAAAKTAGRDPKAPLLALERLAVSYGGIQAVKGIDIDVGDGELVCLIGANGAGKTTTLGHLQLAQVGHDPITATTSPATRRSGSCAAASRWSPRAAVCSVR